MVKARGGGKIQLRMSSRFHDPDSSDPSIWINIKAKNTAAGPAGAASLIGILNAAEFEEHRGCLRPICISDLHASLRRRCDIGDA